jgi:Flp pilus assembly protein CpaB
MKTILKSLALILAAGGLLSAGAQPPSAAASPRLAAGYRAFALPLPGHQLAFLKKGQRVDVLVTFEAMMKGDVKEKVTATILQNVIVLDLLKPETLDGRGVAELMLNPNEAQYAALSVLQGDVRLSARAEGDYAMTPMEMASLRKLFK